MPRSEFRQCELDKSICNRCSDQPERSYPRCWGKNFPWLFQIIDREVKKKEKMKGGDVA